MSKSHNQNSYSAWLRGFLADYATGFQPIFGNSGRISRRLGLFRVRSAGRISPSIGRTVNQSSCQAPQVASQLRRPPSQSPRRIPPLPGKPPHSPQSLPTYHTINHHYRVIHISTYNPSRHHVISTLPTYPPTHPSISTAASRATAHSTTPTQHTHTHTYTHTTHTNTQKKARSLECAWVVGLYV
jgi:hypothetical protein